MNTPLPISADPDFIETPIRYVVKGEKTTFYPADREKSYWPPDDHVMRIENMRHIQDHLSLENNGFVLLKHHSKVSNFFDKEEVKRIFYPEATAIVKKLTGAEKSVAFGDVARSDDPAEKQGRQPSFAAHVDYGRHTIEEYTREILGEEEAERCLQKRVVLINLWGAIKPIHRCPLALCDASTVLRSDLNDAEIRGGLDDPNRPPLWGYNLSHNPDHRWYYAPHMQPGEFLAFKLYDSDEGRVQWTGHTAVDDPTSPPDAPPRESIEIRTISFI